MYFFVILVLNGYQVVKNGEIINQLFLGEYNPSFTKGNRLALPKKLREVIHGNTVILVRGIEKCIYGFDKARWLQETDKHIDLSLFDNESRKLKRYLYSGASETELDSQGRFVLPNNLIEYGGLGDEIYIIGAGDHFEIWQSSNWKEHLNRISVDLSN